MVMVRVKDKGDLYVHQDANWNVVGLTDLGHHLVERCVYTPYGELLVNQETGFGDRDGDNDVDASDKGTVGVTCTGTISGACRVLDLDFDGDYDSSDATKFDALPQGLARHPGRTFSGVQQPFAHQGLLFEPEIGSYQNRARQYDPGNRRFAQRDEGIYPPTASRLAPHSLGDPRDLLMYLLHLSLNSPEYAEFSEAAYAFHRSGGFRDGAGSYIDGLNFYAYATGSPVGLTDPSGWRVPYLPSVSEPMCAAAHAWCLTTGREWIDWCVQACGGGPGCTSWCFNNIGHPGQRWCNFAYELCVMLL
ncbi:MAG: hypothetical protein ACREVG_07670 [Burkholderiales bacterium]